MTYWTNLFTVETWEEFLAAGGDITGHTESRWSRAKNVKPGDRLLCYLKGAKRWVAVLEVTGQPYVDNSEEGRIWAREMFPSRIPVKIYLSVRPEEGVPIFPMMNHLSVAQVLENPERSWGTLFLGSLNRWPDEDGAMVEEALRQATLNPISIPLPPSAYRGLRKVEVISTDAGNITLAADEEEVLPPALVSEHAAAQLTLARLGSAMGYQVFVPSSDRGQVVHDQELGSVPGMVTHLALAWIPAAVRIIENIDVLWLDRGMVVAAFEVEKTTSIYSGLLRMTDLVSLVPNLNIPCFIVAPDDRRSQVFRQVNRPTFAMMDRPLWQFCRYISFSDLFAERDIERSWRHRKLTYVVEELAESLEPDEYA